MPRTTPTTPSAADGAAHTVQNRRRGAPASREPFVGTGGESKYPKTAQSPICTLIPPQHIVLEDFPSPALARSLSPNGRVHWARRHEAKREAAHRVACEALLRRVVPVNGPVRITFRWIFPTAGRHDLDNLIATAKPLIDALVTAGLLEDDDSRHVVGIAAEVRLERGRRALEIEIVQALDPAPREDG